MHLSVMLENLRFFAGEEANEAAFAAMLARFGDVYINDAFSCAHRAHASTHAVAALLPAYAGALLSAEVTALNKVLDAPVRPVVAVVGVQKYLQAGRFEPSGRQDRSYSAGRRHGQHLCTGARL